jgi:hypothetical protein
MAKITLVKAKTSITKRNAGSIALKYLPYVNLAGLIALTLKVLNII